MNKYLKEYLINERIPSTIGNFILSLYLLEQKQNILKQNRYLKSKNLNNEFLLIYLFNNFHTFSLESQEYLIKNIFSKINKNAFYDFFLRYTCYLLAINDYDDLYESLESFTLMGFVKSATISDDKTKIKLILPDNTKIEYENIFSNENQIKMYNGECHNIVSDFLEKSNEEYDVAVVLKDHYILGKYYHSFMIKNGIIIDYASNIRIKYESYLKLINPKVLICESNKTIINNIQKLENNSSFSKSNYCGVLKYAMEEENNKKYN